MGRLFAIPDIHGRLDLLEALVQKLDLRPDDTVVFLGDYVDRGPDSSGVIKYLRELQASRPKGMTICLAGNHEWLMIRALRSMGASDRVYGMRDAAKEDLWIMNGGHRTLASYFQREDQMMLDALWLSGLPLCHEEPGFFFSHAPVPAQATEPYREDALTWGDYDSLVEGKTEKKHVGRVGVCGHIHRLQDKIMAPRMYEHIIYCDCGCGCSKKAPLVAVEVQTREVTYAWPEARDRVSSPCAA